MATRQHLRHARLLVGAVCVSLVLGACGGGGDDDATAPTDTKPSTTVGDGDADTAAPTPGGELVFAIEAESSNGYCLAEAQLAGGGLKVMKAVYDTLTAQTADGDVEPYLASAVEPNDDFTTWTITLRDGVTFHDGSPLDAQIVADNIDAFRGAYAARSPRLSVFVLQDIDTVTVTGPLEVTITTKRPWSTFDDFLAGRIGIMGRAQLDAPGPECANDMIGTGPFQLDHWTINSELVATRNPHYWRTDDEGRALPYLDKVTFVPLPEDTQRVNALLSGDIDALQNPSAGQIAERLRPAAEDGDIELFESSDGVVNYIMLNVSKPPFDNRDARLAVGNALDRDLLVQVTGGGIEPVVDGPFAEGALGYTEDTGFPQHDLAAAKSHADAYAKAAGKPLSFTFSYSATETNVLLAQEVQTQLSEAGIDVSPQPTGDQASSISKALASDFEAMAFAGHGVEDPDKQYIWWYGGSPVNFSRINDPEINRLFDAGRVASSGRDEIYQDLNRRLGGEAYNIWISRQIHAVAYKASVHGLFETTIPGSGAQYDTFLAPLTSTWIDEG